MSSWASQAHAFHQPVCHRLSSLHNWSIPHVHTSRALLLLQNEVQILNAKPLGVSKNCWISDKQCRPWSDAIFSGIWSGSLFVCIEFSHWGRLYLKFTKTTNSSLRKWVDCVYSCSLLRRFAEICVFTNKFPYICRNTFVAVYKQTEQSPHSERITS